MLHRLLDGLLQLLAPEGCAGCGSPLPGQNEPFCSACGPLVEPLEADAKGLPYRALYRYGGPVADAIRRLKYEGCSEVARQLAVDLGTLADAWPTLDAVTAVPLSPKKLRERGYNQSGLLAKGVASHLGVPFRPLWLTRTRDGRRQVGKGRATRLSHVYGMYAASPLVEGKTILVVDDVRTTGATLTDVTRALELAGASSVFQLVVAEADERTAYAPLY